MFAQRDKAATPEPLLLVSAALVRRELTLSILAQVGDVSPAILEQAATPEPLLPLCVALVMRENIQSILLILLLQVGGVLLVERANSLPALSVPARLVRLEQATPQEPPPRLSVVLVIPELTLSILA